VCSSDLALQQYFGGNPDKPTSADEGEAIKEGLATGTEYLKAYSDGFIEWNDKIPGRAKMEELFAKCYFGYLKEFPSKKEIKNILLVEKMLKFKVSIGDKVLPVPLKGSADLVYEDHEDRITIHDHKITSKFSNTEEIDGAKLIQAVFNYFLVYAATGRAPWRMRYMEYKFTENRDKSPQARIFDIIFDENPLMFELFYRMYQDITDAILGKSVFVPNLTSMYDREVSILAYIHRLDVKEEREEQFKKMKVDNITDFLKKKIQRSGSMKKYLEVVSKKFISATTLNYSQMTIEEKIKMKLAEHGLGVEFHSKITGPSVELYRYEPSVGLKMSKIEAYAKDIEQVVEMSGIRVLAPIQDSGLVGFEVPLKKRTFPTEKPGAEGFSLAIGINIQGETVRMDIREAPHMLVAGSTGSGKSVFIANLIRQLKGLGKDSVELVLLDPKMVELQQYASGAKYADNPDEITSHLEALVIEMNRRYKILQENGVKNLEEFRAKGGTLAYIFTFLDEYGDLVNQRKYAEDIKACVLLLGQKARAAGIHVILTTQRPSTKIISGDIKANFPTRVAFKTATQVDSQVIIDQGGAEKLLGKGDMLFRDNSSSQLKRLQGFNL
jgi:hypothetical protein